MSLLTRFALLLIAVASIGAIALISSMDSIDWGNRNCIAEMGDEADRCRRLDDALLTIARIREIRLQIARDLGDDAITFDEAFAALRLLNKNDPDCWHMLNDVYPECTERELLCFQVLRSIQDSGVPSPADITLFNSLIPRLVRELQSKRLLEVVRRGQRSSGNIPQRSGV